MRQNHILLTCWQRLTSKRASGILLFLAMIIAAQAAPLCDTPLVGDYDGDQWCDPAINTRSMGSWQMRLSSIAYNLVSATWGGAAFTPLAGDYDGDGQTDLAVYQDNSGLWLVTLSGFGYAPMYVTLGGTGYVPVAGDYDGDRRCDPAVYQETTGIWLINLSTIGYATVSITLGGNGYTAVPGDFDGDSKADPAVYAQATGTWCIGLSIADYLEVRASGCGGPGGMPIPADYDGDAKADLAVYEQTTGTWRIWLSIADYLEVRASGCGGPGGMPIPADYDSDGNADPAVYQESTQTLTILLSSNNYQPASISFDAVPPVRVLILYDSLGPYGWWGNHFQQMLANLISHFNVPYTTQPVERYSSGDMNGFTAAFYIGCIYDNPLNSAFRQDVLSSTNTVCWIGFNLWQIAWSSSSNETPSRRGIYTNVFHPPKPLPFFFSNATDVGQAKEDNPVFTDKFGFQFDGNESGFMEVRYKGKSLAFPDTNSDVGVVSIVNSNIASAQIIAYRGQTNDSSPYITRGSNLWYVGDNPLGSDIMADRALVFADMLHDILGISHAINHRAVIRIEDVNPMTTVSYLADIALYLQEQNIPYVVSVIPEYRDPLGVDNGGVPRIVTMDDRPDLIEALAYMAAHGGQIVQHGYTHQYDAIPNPHGSTASDYEFYRVIAENGTNIIVGSLPEDNGAWAGQRVLTGQAILLSHGLIPLAWLTPHYYASEIDYGVFPVIFPLALDRGVYFTSDADGVTRGMEHLLPFMVLRDVYGQKRLPETIGYISPSEGILPATLIDRADKNLVVRDGWAGCYYHWFFGADYLPELITGITNLGYRFTTIDPDMK